MRRPVRNRVLTEYLRHYNEARPHRALGQLTQLKLIPARLNLSTSPSTGSAGRRSSADSPTSTTSPHDCPQGTPNRVSEPHRASTPADLRPSVNGFLTVIGVLVFLWVGFELSSGASEEMHNPQRDVPRMIVGPGLSARSCTAWRSPASSW
jgi:hypothetical protein